MKKIFLLLVAVLAANLAVQAQCNRPVINSFSPNTGFIGSKVTIVGANFDATTISNNIVYFGATKATVTAATFGTLEVIVPVGASTAPISVTNQCKLTAYSSVAFNGIFCPTPVSSSTYQNTAFTLNTSGMYGTYNMTACDMDLDGKPDIISGNGSSGITIAKNNSTSGSMSFSAYNFASSGSTQQVYPADFDGDGKKDIATTGYVLKNTSTGSGNFGLSVAASTNSVSGYQIAAGDFNNDGKIDLVGEQGGTMWIALNTSTGVGNFSFGSRQDAGYVSTTCTGIQVADVDGDGKTDILATQGNLNRAVSIRNTTTPGSSTISVESPEYWNSGGSYPYRCQVADFDKDGKIDLTSCNYQGATNTAIWRNTSTVGDISFATTVNLDAPTANYRIQVGDVDGDGLPDIVTKSLGVNVFSVYRNKSTGAGNIAFDTRIDYTSSAQAEVSGIYIGDLDGDYVPDIVTSGTSSIAMRFHRNTSATSDNTAPTASCKNIILALKPDGTATITANDIDNGSSDACGIGSLSASKTSFTCSDIGANSVVLTVKDKSNNTSTCTATVTVTPAAVIVTGQTTVCAGQSVLMTANLGDSYQWQLNGTNISGATSRTYTATQTGDYSVTVTNAGGCSGTSSAVKITVNQNPTVSVSPSPNAYLCPNNVTLTASTSATYQWMKNGSDIAGANVQTYIATTTGTYSVKVIDLFGCSATSNGVTVSNSTNEISVSGSGSYGTVFPNTDNTKNFVISNSGSGNLTVSGISFSGTNGSNWSVPATTFPLTISGNSSATIAVVFNGPTVGNYSGTMTISNDDCDEGTLNFPLTATITCVGAGFSTAPSNMTVNANSSCKAVVTYNAVASGTPAPGVSYEFSGATSGSGSGTGSGSTLNLGTTSVKLTATNACGTKVITFDVRVVDNTPPTVITKNVTISLDADGKASITTASVDNGSSDNCTFSLSLSKKDFTCSDLGTNTVTLTGTDANGNTSSATATVTVKDETDPEFDPKDITVYLDANGKASITPADVTNSTDDNCGPVNVSFTGSGTRCATADETTTLSISVPAGSVITSVDFASYGMPTGSCGSFSTTGCHASSSKSVVEHAALGKNSFSISATNGVFGDPCVGTRKHLTVQVSYGPPSSINYTCANLGENTVALVADDSHGNTTSGSAVVTVKDNIAPTVVTKDITVYLDANGAASISASSVDNGSYDNCSFTLALDKTDYTCKNVGESIVTLTATDASNNTTSATAVVTVVDAIAPTVITKDITVYLDANGSATITPESVDDNSYDNCSFTLALDNTTFGCSNTGANTVTLTATDASNNTTSATAVVTVVDAIAPTVITKDITVYLDANGTASINTSSVDNGSNDNCSFTLALDKTSFNCSNTGENTVTLTATDASNNTTSATAVVTVKDAIAPTVITKDITIYLDANGSASITTASVDNSSYDNCSFTLALDKTSFNCSNTGENTVTLTATDASNNVTSKTAVVTVKDAIAPTVITKDITIYLDANGSASITTASVDNSSYDNCSFTLALDKTSFNCSNTGENTVTLTATDASNNVTSKTAVVTVKDAIAPTVITKDITIYLDANGSASITTASVDNSSYDNCSFTLALDKTSFNCSNTGENTVTLTATDASNNVTSKTAVVTVKDAIAPTVITKDITIYLDANGAASITTASVDNSSYDNCSFTLALDKTSFNCSNTGENTVTLTATDASNNVTSKTATVTVKDAIAPTVITKDITVYLDANGAASITTASVDNSSYDNCSFTLALDKTSFNCSNVGANTVTLTATDASGNVTSKTATVTVKDAIAPTVVTKNVTIYLNASGAASITTSDINNGSTDNCTIATYTLDKTSFNCSNTGANTVTLTVKDVNGNSASATAVVTVKDAIAPVAKAKNISITLDNTTGSASITTASVDNGSYDNCSFTLSLSKTSFNCSNVGDNTVTLTATDASGNTHSTTAVVTVKTTLTANAGSDVTVYWGYVPMASATLTATGNGGNGTYTYKWSTGATTKSITVNPTSTTTYTVTITDGKGCTAKDEVKVTVVDVRCGNKMDKVMVCHGGHTICIDANGVPAHLSNHSDDYIGDCGSRSSNGKIVEGFESDETFAASHAAAQITAYPNPFTSSTTIEFTLGRTQNVSLDVYDIKGARVATLFQGEAEEGVTNYYTVDATNLKADVYFARLITEREVKIVKLIIVK